MEIQNQIKRTLSQPESIEFVISLLGTKEDITRTTLADQLCDEFKFLDFHGERQRAGCIKALRQLEKREFFVLPPSCGRPGKRNPRRLVEPVPEPQGVPEEAGKVEDLRLILVGSEEQMRRWNELMTHDHVSVCFTSYYCRLTASLTAIRASTYGILTIKISIKTPVLVSGFFTVLNWSIM
jgi:hypothetical protein